jgi:hypothetical protein
MEIITAPQPVGEKTDIQLQNEALDADVAKTKLYEQRLQAIQKAKEEKEKPSTAVDLTPALGGDLDARLKGKREIHLIMEYGKRPEVIFSGFWNGKFVGSATNAISRSYRLQRRVAPPVNTTTVTKG